MSKKKSSDKPLDRTQIYVALIGVIGTILVTLITVLANRPAKAEPTQTMTAAMSSVQATGTEQAANTGNSSNGLCLEDYFADVSAENRLSLQAGSPLRVPAQKDGAYGIRLFDGALVGELQFTAESNSKSFRIVSVIDANCSQVFEFGNLDRPIANDVLSDWENLGLTLPAGEYRMRMGWYSGNQIELNFSEN